MAEHLGIAVETIRASLRDQYSLVANDIVFLPLGLDADAGVYRVVSDAGASYLLKVTSSPIYDASCSVPRSLHVAGVTAVVAPLPTRVGALWCQTARWTLRLYPYIAGIHGWQPGLTDEQWRAVGATMRQIHQFPPSAEVLARVRRESFDTTAYSDQMRSIDAQTAAYAGTDPMAREVCAVWQAHRASIHAALAAMERLATPLRQHAPSFVICHADLHPGNIIRADDNTVHLIDWDDVRLAPKERDFLFVGEPGDAEHEAAPFFQGYGTVALNQMALAYFRWERDVQDVLANADIVLNRPDVAEATRVTEAQLLRDILAGGMTDATRAAMADLPSV